MCCDNQRYSNNNFPPVTCTLRRSVTDQFLKNTTATRYGQDKMINLIAKLLQRGYRYHKLRKTFSKFYRWHYELVFNVGLKTLLHQGLSESKFYGGLVYKLKNVGLIFPISSEKIIICYKHIGYDINIMRRSACFVVIPITVNNFASLIARRRVGRQINDGPDIKLFILVGWGRSVFVCCLAHRGSTVGFVLLQCSSGVIRHTRDLQVSVATCYFIIVFICALFVSRDDPLMS